MALTLSRNAQACGLEDQEIARESSPHASVDYSQPDALARDGQHRPSLMRRVMNAVCFGTVTRKISRRSTLRRKLVNP